ncbi:MAG: ATP-dependent Clp protease adapter ClpS [Mariprofundaceae bacterium]
MDTSIFESPEIQTEKPQLKKPSMFKVIMLNDDYTPMDFVIDLLRQLFFKSEEEATQIMLAIHHQGKGICGVYPKDIAESKVLQVEIESQKQDHPLNCRIEMCDND